MKKNWFLSSNGKIIDLENFRVFYIEKRAKYYIFGTDYQQNTWEIFSSENKDKAFGLLSYIFDRLIKNDEE